MQYLSYKALMHIAVAMKKNLELYGETLSSIYYLLDPSVFLDPSVCISMHDKDTLGVVMSFMC